MDRATRVTQNHDAAVAWARAAARLLELVILGQNPSDALGQMLTELEDEHSLLRRGGGGGQAAEEEEEEDRYEELNQEISHFLKQAQVG